MITRVESLTKILQATPQCLFVLPKALSYLIHSTISENDLTTVLQSTFENWHVISEIPFEVRLTLTSALVFA